MDDVPDLISDEETVESEWDEPETESTSVECLFCKDLLPDVEKGFEHCKEKHGFDISTLKFKHSMDHHSYIKMVTFIRTHKVDPLSITTSTKPLWLDDKYSKPVRHEEWLMFDFDSLNENVEAPKSTFHANVENGIVTLTETHFAELLKTIQSLTAQLKESHYLLRFAKEDMEVMKKSMQTLMEDGNGSTSDKTDAIPDCVAKMDVEDDQGYFNTYAHFSIHHDMLFDKVRTESYERAITENPNTISNKCVLDLGCGTGILSMFAASAGAAKVTGIDQSDIIYHAMDIVRENNLDEKIALVKGRIEDTNIPKKVDIIVSEWMGYFLLFEGMLDSVIYARDNYLKPGGVLLPNKCSISIVGSGDLDAHKKFIGCWSDVYGFKMNCMKSEAIREASIEIAEPAHLITSAAELCEIDIYTCTVNSVNFSSEFKLEVLTDGSLTFLVGYFDTFFDLPNPVSFSTGPHVTPTHWKQTLFYLRDPIPVKKGSILSGTFTCSRDAKDIRGIVIHITILGKTYKYILSKS